ncbi:putative E3 ubiquitin-protein ligase RF298 [Carica papaya]|uniref:putative E3 ubiquitin-protein ligase RF298 n=1 Tax=Carica papaya TaxID=3649 RepID=UPI000B8C70FE|nr:putative E3 ubiquitin-protein ligase RF298 [Carica papaya]
MASMIAKGNSSSGSSSQVSPLVSVQEKGSRNKRKFRADPPLGDLNKIISLPQNECPNYEFSAEKFETAPVHGQASACDVCGVNQDHSDGLKLDLGSSNTITSLDFVPSRPRDELEADEFQDADWSDLTESQLEELVLSNLDAIFKSAIKKIVACGYTEEVATKAVLRSGLCYGCKDTVSNIVDNTLAFLRSGQEFNPSREHYFEDLQQLEKYILAELVCVLREVRPFFSTGDAMWCLLICDMNVSHACAMDGDPSSSFLSERGSNGSSSTSTQPHLKTEAKSSELDLPNPCKPVPSVPCSHTLQPEVPTFGAPNINPKPKNSTFLGGIGSDKESITSLSDAVDNKTFTAALPSPSALTEEKFVSSRKMHSGSTKREYILRQKSLHLEKNYRTYGPKASSRAGKLSGLGSLILDKKLKSVSDTSSVNIKNTSSKISTAVGVEGTQDNGNQNFSTNPGASSAVFLENMSTISASPKSNIVSALHPVNGPNIVPAVNNPPVLSIADTELSLSLTSKSNFASVPANSDAEAPNCNYAGIPYDKSLGQWMPHDKKDEMILKLVPRVREMQNQLQEWTEWAQSECYAAARRLNKTNAALRQEMEAAKLRAAESAASCQEVSNREKDTLMKFQSWEKQKTFFQEELMTEKRKVAQLSQELEQAKSHQEHFEARWQQERKAKEELLTQAGSIRKEKEQIEASTKSKEDKIKSKAEANLQRYKDDIQKLEKEISQLRLKTDSSKIAALRRGIDGSYAGKVSDIRNGLAHKESCTPYISGMMTELHDFSGTGGVKRERECVMCLSEEMSVVFIPCAHQVVCTTCNELHEKKGMKECPSCRSPIQQRIPVRYARS